MTKTKKRFKKVVTYPRFDAFCYMSMFISIIFWLFILIVRNESWVFALFMIFIIPLLSIPTYKFLFRTIEYVEV